MKKQFYTFCFLFIASWQFSQAQDNAFKFRAFDGHRSDFGLSYNFFVGDDAEDFRTTIKGFGSGFLLDFYSARASWDMFSLGTRKANISVGAGIAISKYRFSENLILTNSEGGVTWQIDPVPTHDYGTGFFSYGKSKLVSTTLIFPVNLNFHIGDFFLSAGATYDHYLTGKLKRKFKDDGGKQKVVVKNDSFNDFPVERNKFGIGGAIMHKPSGLNIGFTYMMTPFFEEGLGPDLNEVRVSFSYCFSGKFRDPHGRRHHWDED